MMKAKTAIEVRRAGGESCAGCVFRRLQSCPEEINSEWDCMNYRPGVFGIPVKFHLSPNPSPHGRGMRETGDLEKLNNYLIKCKKNV